MSRGSVFANPLLENPMDSIPNHAHPALAWDLDEIAIELTVHCNLKCAMCSVWEGRKHGVDEALARALLEQARSLGARSFIPCGGECFMRKDFTDLLAYADGLGFESSEVVTNGLLLGDHLERLAELQSVRLHFSIDGPESIHDSLRGSGVYTKAMQAVKDALKLGISTGLSGVLMKPTLDTATHILELAADLGMEEVSYQPFQVEIQGMDRDPGPWLFADSDRPWLEDGLAAIRHRAQELGVRIFTESLLDLVPAYYFEGLRPIPPGGCFVPSRFMLVDISGDVFPCFFMRDDVMGNVMKGDKLADVWHSEIHDALQLLAIDSRCPGCLAACSDIASFDDQVKR